MTKQSKTLSGILSFLPAILFIVYIGMFISSMMGVVLHAEEFENDPLSIFSNFAGMIITLILLGISALIGLIYFIVHAINNKKLADNERIIWVLVFVFAGMIGYPIYWYMRIWKTEEQL
jgi:positive regulator of sigma E activity